MLTKVAILQILSYLSLKVVWGMFELEFGAWRSNCNQELLQFQMKFAPTLCVNNMRVQQLRF